MKTALRWTVGLLFLVAGLVKVVSPSEFADAVRGYQLLPEPLVLVSSYLLPWLEAALGLALLTGWRSRTAAAIGGLLSAAFATAIASALLRGLEVDCGCFAGGAAADIGHILLNFGMLAACLYLSLWGDSDRSGSAYTKRHLSLPLLSSITLVAVISGSLVSVRQKVWMERLLPPANSESLVFQPESVDLGQLWQGESVMKEVTYQNVSRRNLAVIKANSSCNCTTPDLSHRSLRPGQSGVLKVGYQAGRKVGRATSRVRLYLAGSSRPAVLDLHADIQQAVSLEPEQLTLSPGETGEVRIVRRRKGDGPVHVQELPSGAPLETELILGKTEDLLRVRLLSLTPDREPADLQSMWIVPMTMETDPPLPLRLVVRRR